MEGIAPLIHWLYWPSLFLCLFFCVRWSFFAIPKAGIAIGALGAAGVLVAIKGEKLTEDHKVIWAVITLVFLVTEIRAINADREDFEKKRESAMESERHNFQRVLDQGQQHFSAIIQPLQENLAINRGLARSNERVARTSSLPAKSLKRRATELSQQIYQFLTDRSANEPSFPAMPTQDSMGQHMSDLNRYSSQTVSLYGERFGSKVISIHDEMAREGFHDELLDSIYSSPINVVVIRHIAGAIGALAEKLKD